MAYGAAEGPPDLEAIHYWTFGPGGPSSPPINDQGHTWPPTCPYIRLDRITGWRALPEADDFRAPKTNADGEVTYPGRMLGKTVVYEGRVMAKSLQSLRSTLTGMVRGFGDLSNEGTMTVVPFEWVAPAGSAQWTFRARVLSLVPDADFEWKSGLYIPFRQGFQINLRMSDPRFYLGGTGYL